ncbi:YhgE/Pip domain-containing protein [Alicyclobacillus herbarius]|uniref:YhgE/Pip domain-containing protein n=1 Tax=Alicyclobacillus herbarius TaxID=122960 RepID=UPI000420D07C|nr:YhgE/Pip domain-containing protein [Alicyclobacillus herbarius]
MNLWTVIRIEARRIWRNRLMRIGLLAMCLLPLLYSALYLWAFWDPYGHLDKLPVAVVNRDQGGRLDGHSVNYGHDLVHSLVKDQSLEWHSVSATAARQGLDDGRYYMEVYIPDSFTSDVLSVNSDHPHKARLIFIPNQGQNYLAGQIVSRVEKDLAASLNQKFSKQFISRLLDVVGQEAGGISKAAAGAKKLADGGKPLVSGSKDLASGVQSADDGAHQLAAALAQLDSGSQSLASGATQVATGTDKVNAGIGQAVNGVGQIRQQIRPAAGPSSQLAQGMNQAARAAGQMSSASQSLQHGLTKAADGSAQLETGLAQSKDASAQVQQGIEAAMSALNQAPASDPHVLAALSALRQSLAGSQKVTAGLGQLQSGAANLTSGLNQEAAGQQKLTQGLDQLSGQLSQASYATGQFSRKVGQLDSALAQLQSGLSTAHTSLAQIANAASQLQSGAKQLQSGLGRAHSGAASLASGLDDAKGGSQSLASGMQKLHQAQVSYADKLADAVPGKVTQPAVKADVMSSTIQAVTHPIHPVTKYGPGLAPYFLPLSLWVGALLLYFLVPLREARWRLSPVSPLTVTLGKLVVLWGIGVIQAVVAASVVLYGLGLTVTTVPGFYLYCMGISITDITVIGMLLSVLKSGPGRVAGIVLLILQLTSAGGTFPIQLVPSFFQAVHPYLPMTYAVAGLRNLIAFPAHQTAWYTIGVHGLFFIGSLALMVLMHARRIRPEQLQAPDTLVS